MNKYTRRDINVKAHLHGESFVTVKDVEAVLMDMAEAAIKAGADEKELMEHLNEKDS